MLSGYAVNYIQSERVILVTIVYFVNDRHREKAQREKGTNLFNSSGCYD